VLFHYKKGAAPVCVFSAKDGRLRMKFLTQTGIILLLLSVVSSAVSADTLKKYDEDNSFKVEIADEETSSDGKHRESEKVIIVTADRLGRGLTEIPLSASVVNKKKIEENVYTTVADLLDDTPGFSQVYDYHSPLVLRGTTSAKMIVLKDGNRCFSSMPQGFMGQNVNLYDINRIEVIRGPGSVIYGSGATTGIINIIGCDIFREKGVRSGLGTSYSTNANEMMGLGMFGWNTGNFAIQLNGRWRDADNMHYGGGKEAINSYHEDKDFSVKTGYRFSEKHKLIAESSVHIGGPWGKPQGFNRDETLVVKNKNDNTVHASLSYTGEEVGFFKDIRVSAYYDYETRDYYKNMYNVSGNLFKVKETNYEDQYGGGNILTSISAGSHFISTGADGYIFKIWSPEKETDYQNSTTADSDGAQGAGIQSIGFFAQDRWQMFKKFHVLYGLRFDVAQVNEGANYTGDSEKKELRTALSGNTGLVYNPTKKSSVTFNAGRAFRMPNAIDMFSERATCAGNVVGNPDLEPEYSWNFDLGYRGKYRGLEWDLAVFSNFYNDMIVKGANSAGDIMYGNTAKARIMGTEAALSYRFRDLFARGMDLKPGMTCYYYMGDDFTDNGNQWNLFSSGEKMTGIPPFRIKTHIRYMYMADMFNVFLEFELDHVFAKNRLPEKIPGGLPWTNEDIDSYTLFHLTAGLRLFDLLGTDEVKLNIKMHNLFDNKYNPFGSWIPAKGRDIRIMLSTMF